MKKEFTKNEVCEMMHNNTAESLKTISFFVERWELDAKEIVEYLIEIADELAAQAIVVSMRDELKFDKPKNEI
jgi:hypothetical protein